jgi:hypothetical protein
MILPRYLQPKNRVMWHTQLDQFISLSLSRRDEKTGDKMTGDKMTGDKMTGDEMTGNKKTGVTK